MIAEQLKKAVLQAAIQGKLTNQRPEDGDARDLLKEIKAEKARLVKEGKLKKEKPLPEITEDEIPFEIPENWVWVRLGNIILTGRSGGTPDTKNTQYYGGQIPFVTIKDMTTAGMYIDKTFSSITDLGVQNSSAWIIDPNHILYSMYASIGKVSINKIPLASSQAIFAMQLIDNEIFRNFVYTYLLSMESKVYKQAAGTTQLNINAKIVKEMLLPLPPLAEQQRIVERLEEVLPEIDQLAHDETKLDELEKAFPKKMKDAILQYAIQGKLTEQLPEDGDARDLLKEIQQEKAKLVKAGKIKKTPPLPPITEDEIPFDIPENWVWCGLGEMVSLISGTSYNKGDIASDGIRILRGGNVIDKKHEIKFHTDDVFVSKKYLDNEKQVKENDVVIVGSTGSSTVIGKPAFVTIAPSDSQIGAFLRIIRPLYDDCIAYIHTIFKSSYYREHISNSVQGTNIFNIRADIILEMPIPLPPLAEQKRIVDRLEELLPLCEKLE